MITVRYIKKGDVITGVEEIDVVVKVETLETLQKSTLLTQGCKNL